MAVESPGSEAEGSEPDDRPAVAAGPLRRTSRRARRLRRGWPYLALFVVALALRLWMPGPVQVTTDEPLWLLRSQQFSKALSQGDLSKATAWGAVPGIDYPTMPGVTTMWAGTAGRGLTRLGSVVGLNAPLPDDPLASPALVRWSRTMVALAVSLGLVAFTWAASRAFGRRAAFIAGALCAVEPWLIGHSFLLHTDAMVTVFGATSLVAMVAALRPRYLDGHPPDRSPAVAGIDRTMLGLSAVTGALAVATKLNGLVLVAGGAGIIGLWAVGSQLRRLPRGERWWLVRSRIGWGAAWLVVVVLVFVVLWPAVWVSPGTVLHDLRLSADNPGPFTPQFFLGSSTHHPGPWFYPVTFVFRVSPWSLVAMVVIALLLLARVVGYVAHAKRWTDRLPRVPWVLIVALVPYALVIADYQRRYDRYGLVFVPVLAILVGVVVQQGLDRLRPHVEPRRFTVAQSAVAVIVFAAMAGTALSTAPYEIAYVDPLVGGQKRAEHVMLLGWGEQGSVLGRVIAGREVGRCDDFAIARPIGNLMPAVFPCGRHVHVKDLSPGDYLVVDVNQVQRGFDVDRIGRELGLRFDPLKAVTIGGVAYATLYQVEAS